MAALPEIPYGSDIKVELNATACGFTMDDDDFYVNLYVSPKNKHTIPKADMKKNLENGKYIFTAHTADIGVGYYTMETVATVPDTDFAEGIRIEIERQRICRVIP